MKNTTIRIVLGNSPLTQGYYAIYLRITKDRKKKEINLGLKCLSENFLNEQLSKKHKNFRIENELLISFKSKALSIIREFQLQDYDFTLKEFENEFRGSNNTKTTDVISFFDEYTAEMESAGRVGNARVYRETKQALMKFAGSSINFRDINIAFLEKFEAHLRSRGNIDGSIGVKMRQLKALYNTAIRRKLIDRKFYPFEEYKTSKLKSKKNKRALSVEDFKRIRDVDLSKNPDLIEAHNYIMFSFFTRGMNFVDIMKLKWSDIQDGRIYYTRSKTKGQFSIQITENVKEILSFYRCQNRKTDYVFPILLKDDLTPQQILNRKHKVLSRVNQKLKQIAKIAGVEKNITTYTFRHSFATILKQIGTSTDVISELMGHSDVQTTMTYLKEFDTDLLDQENRKLLNL